MFVSVMRSISDDFRPVVRIHSVNFNSRPVSPLPLSIAFPTSSDFGNPLLPVINTLPLRRATNAPVLTVGHQISPLYSMAVTVAKSVR